MNGEFRSQARPSFINPKWRGGERRKEGGEGKRKEGGGVALRRRDGRRDELRSEGGEEEI